VSVAAPVETIEDIILTDDRRGIAVLRPFLPDRFCEAAARLIPGQQGNVFIVTGFFMLCAGLPETDGPPGALAMGRALDRLGFISYYVTDRFTAPLLEATAGDAERVITFPLADREQSERYALDLLEDYRPAVLIATERCGETADGRYLNISGRDISPYNARVDYLFHHHGRTIGIGDGGNEIGMGSLANHIPACEGLPRNPCITATTRLVIASVSNWGAYGLLAALSGLTGLDLLPAWEEEAAVLERMVAFGAVDGIDGKRVCTVDGFSLEKNRRILERLHLLVGDRS